jgi:hypothetical protein
MIEFVNAANSLTWPGAFAVGCACLSLGAVGYAAFK